MSKTIKDYMAQDYDYVSYRLTLSTWRDEYLDNEDLCYEHSTFAGSFAIKDGKLIPLDGDTYDINETVIWSEEWTQPEDNIQRGLTVIVPTDWYRPGPNGEFIKV